MAHSGSEPEFGDTVTRQTMRDGQLAEHVRLVHRGGDFIPGIAGSGLVDALRASTAGHDLEEVHAVLEQLTRPSRHPVDTVGLGVAPPEMATSDGDGWSADQERRYVRRRYRHRGAGSGRRRGPTRCRPNREIQAIAHASASDDIV